MKKPARFLLCLVAVGFFSFGCARYPMGMTKSEWNALTPGQQDRYRRLQEKDHREYLGDWATRHKDVDQRVKDPEQRVQMGPDGYTPPAN